MKSEVDLELHLRWVMRWIRDLLELAEDLVAYGGETSAWVHIDFYQQAMDIALELQSLMVKSNSGLTVPRDWLRKGDADFPTALVPRGVTPVAAEVKAQLRTYLRKLSIALDPVERSTWPGNWSELSTRIERISTWIPP